MTVIPIDGRTQIMAILGNPIEHTLSPAMYNAAFRELRMNSVYVALAADKNRLAEAVKGIRTLGIWGGNVTIPFKEAIIPYLDGLTEEARLIGAVNTFYWIPARQGKQNQQSKQSCRGGRNARNDQEHQFLWGDNTDGAGFLAAIRKAKPQVLCEPKAGAILWGAGGAARAVAISLALAGIPELTIINRNLEKAESLAEVVRQQGTKVNLCAWPSSGENGEELKKYFRESRLIINTTPLGMTPQEEDCLPVDETWFQPGQLVVDLIYRPRETVFLHKAKVAGCQILNGLSMLLEQGILSFQRWTGTAAPAEVMAKELERWV